MTQGTTAGAEPARTGVSILLVDDDVELCELMREFFARRDIRLEAVHDGRLGLARALGGGHDLLLLDVMMPGLDGFELLRQVRRRSQLPVIMLTARTAQMDRVAGLDAGADDYLPKPFGPEELLARIRAVLRNAIRYAPEGTAIEVDLRCHEDTATIRVRDHGIGVPRNPWRPSSSPSSASREIGAVPVAAWGSAWPSPGGPSPSTAGRSWPAMPGRA